MLSFTVVMSGYIVPEPQSALSHSRLVYGTCVWLAKAVPVRKVVDVWYGVVLVVGGVDVVAGPDPVLVGCRNVRNDL